MIFIPQRFFEQEARSFVARAKKLEKLNFLCRPSPDSLRGGVTGGLGAKRKD
ncbi:MAG TPA: hypothetical protein VGB62_03720 [Allosphingosinicella sp.]|jgi:hypothetical protein